MSVIRLTVTPKIQFLINRYKIKYPLLDEPEIVKMLISRSYIEEERLAGSEISSKELFSSYKEIFNKWLKEKGIDRSTLTEEEAYELIKN